MSPGSPAGGQGREARTPEEREYRLRHWETRRLSEEELDEALKLGYLSEAQYDAEYVRRGRAPAEPE